MGASPLADCGADPAGGLLVLGLDPGSRATGYGLVLERSGQLHLVKAGVLRPKAQDMAERLGQINEAVDALISEHRPHVAAVENVFSAKNAASALKLGQARGAAIAACSRRGLPVHGYEPTVIKKQLVGVGRADKEQVAFMVGRLLGKTPDWAKDASDALAAAICHLNMRRFKRLTGA